MELSKRLKAVADMVTPGNRVTDVGCDHGYVSIYLIQEGIAPKVYAMDVRTGPLERAREHVNCCQLEDYIELRLSDGVQALSKGEADCMICAGMGGRVMSKIISEGSLVLKSMKELILQPQSELMFFRSFLRENGYKIVKEDMVIEDGKYYPIIKVNFSENLEQSSQKYRIEDKFGPYLIREHHPVLESYLSFQEKTYRDVLTGIMQGDLSEKCQVRIAEIQAELDDIATCRAKGQWP